MPDAQSASAGRVLIVGAGRGIGAATARRFASEGYAVTLLGRDRQRLTTLAASIPSATEIRTVVADVLDISAYEETLQNEFAANPPDAAIYNVARVTSDSLLDHTGESLASTFLLNVSGAVLLTRAMAATEAAQTEKRTVIFSGGGLAVAPDAVYSTLSVGKSALRTSAIVLNEQLQTRGIHVASVTITGALAYGGPFDPDKVADNYWDIHDAPRGSWLPEYVFDGSS